jgi:hypothetical protein
MMQILLRQPVIWGPIFLICTIALAARVPFDLLFLALSGLYLSAQWKMRGCVYALVLLFIAASLRHLFYLEDHLFQLGLEGSLAVAFFVTALAFEQGATFIESLTSQIETRKAAVTNLEEEMEKMQQSAQELQISFQEKVATLQKELEELQADHSSILILNEVLRKNAARHMGEAENFRCRAETLQSELESAEKDLAFLKETDAVVIQNRELMAELNAARYEKEQTHLINETLARLYARENFKAKEIEQEVADYQEQLKEADRMFERLSLEAHRVREELQQVAQIQNERNFLKERLQIAQEELELASNRKTVEPLYLQLKKQFEEKNQILHQVRSELFKADTELQRLKIEKAALELNPIPKEFERELEDLVLQVEVLEEENAQLMGQIEKKKSN